MLRALEIALTDKCATPSQIAAGLRQAMLAIYASQVGLLAIPALVAWLLGRSAAADLGWTWWLLALALLMATCIAGFAEREFTSQPSLRSGLQFAILLGGASALPAIFAWLLVALEGWRFGAGVLFFVSLQLLIFASARLLLLARRIPPRQTTLAAGSSAALESVDSSANLSVGISANVRS